MRAASGRAVAAPGAIAQIVRRGDTAKIPRYRRSQDRGYGLTPRIPNRRPALCSGSAPLPARSEDRENPVSASAVAELRHDLGGEQLDRARSLSIGHVAEHE